MELLATSGNKTKILFRTKEKKLKYNFSFFFLVNTISKAIVLDKHQYFIV